MFIEIITETGRYKIRNDPARIAKFHADYAAASKVAGPRRLNKIPANQRPPPALSKERKKTLLAEMLVDGELENWE